MGPLNEKVLPAHVARWVAAVAGAPASYVEHLSDRNSQVWRVKAAGEELVVKQLTDRTSDPSVERAVLERLPSGTSKRVLAVEEVSADEMLVLTTYVRATPLASWLPGASPQERQVVWRQIGTLCAQIAASPVRGAGRVDVGPDGVLHGRHLTWGEFLTDYLARQERKAPETAACYSERLRGALGSVLEPGAAAAEPLCLMSADLNNHNLALGEAGQVVLLNVPLAWAGDPRCALGELTVHWFGTAQAAQALDGPDGTMVSTYAAFHAFVILAYVESRTDEDTNSALIWGTEHRVVDVLAHTLDRVARAT